MATRWCVPSLSSTALLPAGSGLRERWCSKTISECARNQKADNLIRHFKDAFAKSESKLPNFPELKLSRLTAEVLLQSLSGEVRQHVVLHGKSDNWKALRKSCTTRNNFDFATSLGPLEPSVTSSVTTMGRRTQGKREKKGEGRSDQTPKGRTPVLRRQRQQKKRREGQREGQGQGRKAKRAHKAQER